MDNESDTTQNLMSAFEAIEEEVLELHAKWNIFKQLFGKSEKRIALLNDFAPDFFSIIHDSLLYDIFLTISRLTDPAEMGRWKNMTFRRLIAMLASDGRSQELIDNSTAVLKTVEEQCETIRPWRRGSHTKISVLA